MKLRFSLPLVIPMKNTLPKKRDRLFAKAEDMAMGLHNHGAAIGVMHITEAALNTLLADARAADNVFQGARTLKRTALQTRRALDKSSRAFMVTARDVIKPNLGQSWSQPWTEVGFLNNSLAIPGTLAERITLLMSLKLYFTAHSAHENEPAGATADAALVKHTLLHDANATVNACSVDIGTKKTARDEATQALRDAMIDLMADVRQLLAGDDPRWSAFGLNMPDAVGLPEAPENLVVTGGAPGHLFGTWDSAALADRYRQYRKITGVDSDYV